MNAFDLDRNIRWLFCLTHPDDEIAIAAWIRRLAIEGCDVFLSWTHDTPVRELEARHAATWLGVPDERLFFHHARDQHVIDELPQLEQQFHQMVEQVRPDRIVCGAFEQGHIDHDGTNWLVNQVFDGPVYEFPLYHTYLTKVPVINRFADPAGQEVLHLTPDEARFKKRIAKLYPSQRIWANLVGYEALAFLRMRPGRLRMTERMRLQTHRSWLSPNLPEHLTRRVLRSPVWRRWEAAMRAVESEIREVAK